MGRRIEVATTAVFLTPPTVQTRCATLAPGQPLTGRCLERLRRCLTLHTSHLCSVHQGYICPERPAETSRRPAQERPTLHPYQLTLWAARLPRRKVAGIAQLLTKGGRGIITFINHESQ